MIGKLRSVVLDAPDIAGLSAFYQGLLGWTQAYADDEWVTLTTPDGYRIALQHAPDLVPAQWPGQEHPQQFHLDIRVPDLEAASERAEKLGATRLGGGETWHTLADPAGHPFDLVANDEVKVPTIYGVTLDCPDPKALAGFYAELLGMQVLYDGDEGALIGAEDQGQLMFQKVSDYNPPQWPDPAHPQQYHLDITVTDIDEAEPKALALGATKLEGAAAEGTLGEGTFRVYADPAGHPFCLCW